MRIGALATAGNCPVERIRYYEKIGLLPDAAWLPNDYRSYDDKHRRWLQFIIRSQKLGFSQAEVRKLTDLAHQERPACSDVYGLLKNHIRDVRERICELRRLEKALLRLICQCHEDTLPECRVIDELMG